MWGRTRGRLGVAAIAAVLVVVAVFAGQHLQKPVIVARACDQPRAAERKRRRVQAHAGRAGIHQR